ncbi:helix-turn-helix domain-containing protein [Pyrinomonas methylaliphatogenes]|uniref:helix-turn-helix domain-containing protein n=1 Tax=Pyrinomonas methylaliphatogenes TaxID=454194 RepID=UPI0012FE721A|nr:helix-turn-helix domain-containing protein [Pyrinomonas methylaliphatogenes]
MKKLQVPWARAGLDFTPLFEALLMSLVKEMPVKAIVALVGEHDTVVHPLW